MMKEQRPIDDAKIRAVAAEVEIIVGCLQSKGHDLQKAFDSLHDEMYLADPVKDKAFDKFMRELAQAKAALDNLWGLQYFAKILQSYGLPAAAPVPMPKVELIPEADAGSAGLMPATV